MAESIIVKTDDLVKAIRKLNKTAKPREQAEAILRTQSGKLTISTMGAELFMEAEGEWTMEVRIPLQFLSNVAKAWPPQDKVTLQVKERELVVGDCTVPCVTQVKGGTQIEAPLNPSLDYLLSLPMRHTQEEIVRSGLSSQVSEAVQQREEVITKAREALALVGISEEDVREFITERIKRRHCK